MLTAQEGGKVVSLMVLIGKAVPLQAWTGPEGSRKLRLPDFMTTAQDGGKVVSLMVGVNIDYSPTSSTEANNEWSHTSTPLYAFMSLTLETLRLGTYIQRNVIT